MNHPKARSAHRPLRGVCRVWALATALMAMSAPEAVAIHLPDQAPSHLVFDAPSLLSLEAKRNLEGALLQHQHFSGEQLFLVLLAEEAPPSQPIQETEALTQETFNHWDLETTRRGKNALLMVRSVDGGKPEASVILGSGISLPDGASASELSHSLADLLTKPPRGAAPAALRNHWDQAGLSATRRVLEHLKSPVLEQLPEDFWSPLQSIEPAGPTSRTSAAWVWALLGVLLAAGAFYWTLDQISRQAVLIGAERWILLSPRLSLVLRWKEMRHKRQPSPRKAAPKLFWRGTNG